MIILFLVIHSDYSKIIETARKETDEIRYALWMQGERFSKQWTRSEEEEFSLSFWSWKII